MLAELQPSLNAEPWRGQARFFPIEDYCKIEPRVTRKEALFEIESWAKKHGYIVHVNDVGYVSILRHPIDLAAQKANADRIAGMIRNRSK